MSNVLLDNPVLASLNYSQAELGRCSERAAVYDPDISPLAGVSEPVTPALQELAALVAEGSAVGAPVMTLLRSRLLCVLTLR